MLFLYMFSLLLTPWLAVWPGDWFLTFSSPFPFSCSQVFSSQISPHIYSVCQTCLSFFLPGYWPFSSLLDQSDALGRQSETNATHHSGYFLFQLSYFQRSALLFIPRPLRLKCALPGFANWCVSSTLFSTVYFI